MTIGIHDFDIKLILKGKQFEVSAFPIKYEEKTDESDFVDEDNPIVHEVFVEKVESYDDLFPQIEGSPTSNLENNKVKKFDFSSIIQKNHVIAEIEDNKNDDEETPKIEVLIDDSKYMTICNENKENLLIIDKLNAKIYSLEKKLKELEITNAELKNKNAREMEIIRNKHKYDEILHNLQNLNAISKQFCDDENYSKYLIDY
jgi:hypothetical protein